MAKDQDSIEARLARLEAAEKALKDRESELDKREKELANVADSGATRPVRPSEIVHVGDGWEFTVSCRKAGVNLPTKKIQAADETEALRWYVATTSDPDKPTKQIDPLKYPLQAVCTDPKRLDRQRATLRLASMRAKLEGGGNITDQEFEELQAADLARAGLQ